MSESSWLAAGVLLIACAGCQLPAVGWNAPAQSATDREPEIPQGDTGFTPEQADSVERATPQAPRVVHELTILHVLVPRGNAESLERIWQLLREDAVGAETSLRLRQNGLRVGVGHAQWWEPIKAAIDSIEDHRVTFAQTVRTPPGFAVTLEFDAEPHEQTLFYVGSDGVLSGSTWPESRNVLRVTCGVDSYDADRVRVFAVPEVHQRRAGWEWVRSEAGLWNQAPRLMMQAFDAAGVALSLGPGEFALLAPSPNARIYGLLGGAFLTRVSDRQQFDSYVFLRPEARFVGRNE